MMRRSRAILAAMAVGALAFWPFAVFAEGVSSTSSASSSSSSSSSTSTSTENLIDPARSIAVSQISGNTFSLQNTTGQAGQLASTGIESVAWLVLPPGGIVPPANNDSPLTVLPNSKGFDPNALEVLLAQGDRDGQQVQALGLTFGGSGLEPGGVLNFQVSLAPGINGINLTPELVHPTVAGAPTPPAADMTSTSSSSSSSSSSSATTTSTPMTNAAPTPVPIVPEPMSILVWSGVIGLGLWRAGSHRRAMARTRA